MLLTKKELCKRWKVSARWLENLSFEELPRINISGGTKRILPRFRKEDVQAYEIRYLIGKK